LLVHAFSGKSITEGGYNPAKGKDYDGKQLEVKGNMINVEKTKKENASKKDSDYGYVPTSWQLIEVHSGEVIKSGIADYDVCEDGTIIATNGRRIFEIKDGSAKKVCNAQCCMHVNAIHRSKKNNNLFDF
jgi:hypothetical protein